MGQGEGGLCRCSEHWDQRRREPWESDFPEPKALTSLGLSCAEAVSLGKMDTPPFAWGCGLSLSICQGRDGLS